MSKVIFGVAGDGKTISYQTTVADDYSLQANEQTDGQGMLALNPCSYFDGVRAAGHARQVGGIACRP